MHEHSLLADLLAKIDAVARAHGATRVRGVTLQLGPLAHISPAHLGEHFRAATRGTPAEDAELTIETLADIHHPQAQDIVLRRIEVEDDGGA